MRHGGLFHAPFVLLVLLFTANTAWASLQVFPTRLVLDEKTKVGNLSLRHVGTKPCRYKITTVFYRMNSDGRIEPVPEPLASERPAMKLIRFSPRQTTLSPNLEQVVRVMYAGPRTLPPGEYRAHLHFEPLDEELPESDTANPGKIKMQLAAKIAIAVPVIYRHGNPAFDATLSDLKLIKGADNKMSFSVDLASTGDAFPFGDFYAYYIPKQAEGDLSVPKQVQVGFVRGVASYVPKRLVKYALSVPSGLELADGGRLRLEYRQGEDAGGKLIQAIEKTLP